MNDEALKASITDYVGKILRYQDAINEDQTPLARLLSLVGRHLSGRRVGVRMRKTIHAAGGVLGTFYPTPRNGAIIDLDPSRPLPEIYQTFLHETAHALHDYQELEENELVFIPSGSYERPSALNNPWLPEEVKNERLEREREADAQRDAWDAFASDPARLREVGWNASAPDGPIEFYKLHVLANKNL